MMFKLKEGVITNVTLQISSIFNASLVASYHANVQFGVKIEAIGLPMALPVVNSEWHYEPAIT